MSTKEKKTKKQVTAKNKEEKSEKIWRVVSKILLCLVVSLFLIILIRTVVFKKTEVFGYRIYLIMSGSMEPEINVKDAIITRETTKLQKGDIIAFQKDDITTVHRIVNIITKDDKTLYQTKGDKNNIEDADLIEQNDIKGKYIGKIAGVGDIVVFLKQNLIFVILAIGIIIIIILVRRLL